MPIDINGKTLSSAAGTSLTMASGATTWMTVASNGVVTRPQIPYMKAILSGQGTFYRANPVVFGSVIANVGSCWNNTSGTFTCPRAGYYLAGMSGIASGGANGQGTAGYFYIMKNGSSVHFSHWNTATYWDYVNLSAVVSCAAGDTIGFQINPTTGYFYGQGDHGNFFITLLR